MPSNNHVSVLKHESSREAIIYKGVFSREGDLRNTNFYECTNDVEFRIETKQTPFSFFRRGAGGEAEDHAAKKLLYILNIFKVVVQPSSSELSFTDF